MSHQKFVLGTLALTVVLGLAACGEKTEAPAAASAPAAAPAAPAPAAESAPAADAPAAAPAAAPANAAQGDGSKL